MPPAQHSTAQHRAAQLALMKHQRGLVPSPSTHSTRFCASATRMGPCSEYTSISAQACWGWNHLGHR